jgi:two-component system phosphate regulon response regulator PhoB
LNNCILVADDEPDVLRLVGSNLTHAGFQVLTAEDGPTALAAARRDTPTLVVLDIMMPGMTGLEITRVLKRDAATAAMSIVLLSARNEEVDRVLGFELGVDDFVSKPFSPRELVLRVRAIVGRKRTSAADAALLHVGEIALDRERHDVSARGTRADLTAIEFKLLLELMKASGRVLTREDLLDRIWGSDAAIESRTIDTHLRRLREKLGDAGGQIQTVRGFGYRLEAN